MTDRLSTDQLIGRARDLERVTRAVAVGRPVLIVGEPGVGKTALARAGASAVAPPRIWEGGGIATLDWMSYLPFRRALGLPLPEGDATLVAEFLIEHADNGVFIADDLQWVDGDTLTASALLAEQVPIIAATRPMPHGDDVRARLGDAGFEVIELTPLADADAARLASIQNPSLTPPDAESVARRAGGNPLLIQGLAHAQDDATELSYALRARLMELSRTAREALHRIAVLERPTRLDIAAGDRRQLLDMGLVTETREGVQVRHALLADAVLGDLSPAHVRELHRAVAQRVEDPGEAARHWAAAGERGRARELALEASRTADRPVERARCAALAAQCLDGAASDEELVTAMNGLAAHEEFAAVVDLSTEVTPGGPFEPEACRLRARGLFEAHNTEGAEQAIEAGIAAAHRLEDDAAAVRLEITAAYHDLWVADGVTRRPTELIDRARALGVADAEMHVQAGAALLGAFRNEEAADLARRGRELARIQDHAWAEQESWVAQVTSLSNLGRIAEAEELCRSGEEELLERGYHHTAATLRGRRAELMAWQCGYDEVIALTDALLARPALHAGASDFVWRNRAIALGDTGRSRQADAVLDQVRGASLPERAYWLAWIRAECCWSRGDAEAAAVHAYSAVDLALADFIRPQAGATLARAQWECAVPLTFDGRTEHGGGIRCYNAEIDGLAALQAGATHKAIALFEEAIATCGYRRHRLRYQLDLAEAIDLVDPERATTHFELLVRELREVGWIPFLERVAPLLDSPPGGRRLRPTHPPVPDGITQREHDALTLVADGLTSRAIAERLAISQPTVESHIRSAMRKLDARTRTEAAAMIRAPHDAT